MQKWKFYYNLHTLKLFQTCINVFQQLNTEETFWIMLVTKQLPIAFDFHSVGKKILWKSMATVNYLSTNIFLIFFCDQHDKDNLTGLEQLKGA